VIRPVLHYFRRCRAQAPRGQFWLFFIAALFFSFGFSIFFFLFNLYLLGFRLNERSLGLIGGLMAFGSILGTIPAGICAQRFGLRRTLVIGLLCTVVFSLGRTCFLAPPAQFALAVLTGMTLCSWAVCLSPTVAGLTTEAERPFAFSLMFSSGIVVAALGALVAGQFPGWLRHAPHSITSNQASRITLQIACGVAALAIVPLFRLNLPAGAPRVRPSRLSNPFLRRFLPAMAVWALVTGSLPPFANVYFVHHLGLSLPRMGLILSLSQVVQFLAILCAPLLFRRTGLVKGVVLTQIATAAVLAALALTDDAIRGVIYPAWLYPLYMAVQYMNEPGIYSLLMDQIPADQRSSASASTFFVTSACQAVASAIMGVVIVRFGYSVVLLGIALIAAAATLLFTRLSRLAPVAPDHLREPAAIHVCSCTQPESYASPP
jgi:MFS family permease